MLGNLHQLITKEIFSTSFEIPPPHISGELNLHELIMLFAFQKEHCHIHSAKILLGFEVVVCFITVVLMI